MNSNWKTIEILQEEMALKEEHFKRLLPKVKVGQHAQLLKLWEDLQVWTSNMLL